MTFLCFEDLRVFQLAEKLSDYVWEIVLAWTYFEKITMGTQFIKAADSIGANIAEGSGRGAVKDNQRFIRIARGSLNETKYWARRAKKRKLIDQHQEKKIKEITDELAPTLNAYLSSIGKSTTN
jgi:four helix bundle protein